MRRGALLEKGASGWESTGPGAASGLEGEAREGLLAVDVAYWIRETVRELRAKGGEGSLATAGVGR